ncbi:MAG: peptide-methionine (S)-S-oxide reductase [Verrucomicrobia bacterium TMED60]|nr:MAG: peptide-methionine (S)-S-oxide reductase [Verrucomicrobia bacterium TMED60]|tara:strand:- start:279 stop:854 length:576 start_codon:yes stop_codon:yes gene_type:complete
MKYLLIIFLVLLNFNHSKADKKDKAYFAGGCFWCVEESFEKLQGVEEVISGYSGGTTENPTYKEVTYGNTGHFEVVEIIYDKKVITYKELLDNFWINIDPFDAFGQFCDKGYSYRSVAFYQTDEEKSLIEKDMRDLENRFNKKVVTYIRNFKKFYKAEEYHQDFYKVKLERYLRYKKACGREEILKRIWSQ